MVTVLTESSLLEHGLAKELFGERSPKTDLIVFNTVNPPSKKERAKSSTGQITSFDRKTTRTRSEFSSKTQDEMNQILSSTQKAFNSQLR